jgi:TPP-dependent pyruvate/acetoin dehydrogenase alpha subunit
MLMESMNLASAWNLPVLFVCKDDGWAITTQSERVTGGDLNERARGLGIPAVEVDGCNVSKVWEASHSAIERARSGQGPTFLHARCVHFEGHFLGFQLLRIVRDPIREITELAVPLTHSFLRPGGVALRERVAGMKEVLGAVLSTLRDPRRDSSNDPVQRTRKTLLSERLCLRELEEKIEQDINHVFASILPEVSS